MVAQSKKEGNGPKYISNTKRRAWLKIILFFTQISFQCSLQMQAIKDLYIPFLVHCSLFIV
jgi:hypothetical protein